MSKIADGLREAIDSSSDTQWAIELCTLLDLIELHADDAEKVRELCRARFEIAEKHGLTVVFSGEAASGVAQ